ncbi:phage portal protein [Cupriavidus sp. CV2]|uniref:phage portal protein n=1 Tax=Cupriavidus ulmosensis TaxID=3065913 RepID=UPI00296A963C|nr:phage portal protein [Cupriavidus sp. CV2]MDW3683096.1 phage portal protein [Cupriavidus sp. CV2]
MAFLDRLKALVAGRLRKAPQRDTQAYARLMSLGGQRYMRDRPLIKPTPTSLRNFASTPYARRAINYIKNPIAQLEWEVSPIPGVKGNRALQQQIEVVTNCLKSPNRDDSFRSFVEQLVEDLLIGAAGTYEHQVGSDPARPLWMWPVDALSIQIYPGWAGGRSEARYCQVIGYGNVGGVQGNDLTNDELVYIRMDPNTSSPYSSGPLEVAFQSINRQLGVGEYAGQLTTNAQPENLLNFPGMDSTTLQSFRNYWRDDIEGQGQTPITGFDGAEILKLRGTNDDALFLKYQEFVIREIAIAFGISPMKLGVVQDVNRSTAEVSDDADWDVTITPLARLIQSYINRKSIHGRLGFSQIWFRFLGLDRDDEQATADIYTKYYQNNAITPNQQREKLGQPPMESSWGDMTYADVQIAIKGAQGAKAMNPDLATKE